MRKIIFSDQKVVPFREASIKRIIAEYAGVIGVLIKETDEGVSEYSIMWATGHKTDKFKTVETLVNSISPEIVLFEI